MKKAPQPSANARAVGAGAASLVIALSVCLFTYALRTLDFAPVRALVIKEDHLYDAIHSPDVSLLKNAHRIVFIDIDDEAVRKWNTPEGGSPSSAPLFNDTPRKLIAQLAKFARAAQAKVVFLDFDFRNSVPDDKDLHDELAKANQPPILIPTFFTSGRLPPCDDQGGANPPTELKTVFSDLTEPSNDPPPGSQKGLPSIVLVHPVLTLGAYGLPEGACSSYRVRFGSQGEMVSRQAAMARAVELAIADSPACGSTDKCIKRLDLANPEILPIRWTIGNDTDQKHDSADNSPKIIGAKDTQSSPDSVKRLAYARVKASTLVRRQDILDPLAVQLDVLKDAIVIIGSTAQWSEDTLVTPLGDLQGVLAHVNLALSLQSSNDEAPLCEQFLVDVLLILLATAATVWFCFRPIFRAEAKEARLSWRLRLRRVFFEACLVGACGVVFAVGSAALLYFGARFLAGWRFGILSFIVGGIVALMIEICSAVADTARERAEVYCMRRRTHELPKTAQQEGPVGSSPESMPP
jgi:CHASE2 domain-containing sensor protein